MAALDAVHEQQQFFLVAQLPQAEQIFRRGGRDAAFALHAFDQDGDGRGRNRVPRGVQIVERNVPETRRHRLEPFFHLVLAGGGDAGERPAMKGIRRRENFKPALVVAEFPGQLEQTFIRLRAAVGEKAFARADALDDFSREPALRLGEIQIRDVNQFFRLLHQRLRDGRVRVAEAANGDAAAEVEVAFAGDIENVAASAVAQREIKASVAGHDVFAEQIAHGLELVVNERRRRWNDFFHRRIVLTAKERKGYKKFISRLARRPRFRCRAREQPD